MISAFIRHLDTQTHKDILYRGFHDAPVLTRYVDHDARPYFGVSLALWLFSPDGENGFTTRGVVYFLSSVRFVFH